MGFDLAVAGEVATLVEETAAVHAWFSGWNLPPLQDTVAIRGPGRLDKRVTGPVVDAYATLIITVESLVVVSLGRFGCTGTWPPFFAF